MLDEYEEQQVTGICTQLLRLYDALEHADAEITESDLDRDSWGHLNTLLHKADLLLKGIRQRVHSVRTRRLFAKGLPKAPRPTD